MPEVPAEPPPRVIAEPQRQLIAAPPLARADALAQPQRMGSYYPSPSTPATFLSGGYILTFVGGPHPATGHGAELSLLQYLQSDLGPAIGPVLQLQNYSSDGHGHARLNAGAEFALVFGGCELMYSYRGGFAGIEPTHGVTIGPFFSLVGIAHVAGRITIALSPDERSAGNEYGVTLGLKIPVKVAGGFFNFGHGRPCADLRVALESIAPMPLVALAEFWRRAAEAERTSVVAFERLALCLAERGAPPELLAECLSAAEDEARHAELARRRTERHANTSFAFDDHAAWLSGVVAPSFAELARESVADGCFGEGVAARILALAAEESADPELAAELAAVASDEARHAELAWAVVSHCLERDREAVMRELADWLQSSAPGTASLEDALLPRGHGALAPAQQTAISELVWSEVVLRLHGLLS